MQSNTLKNVLVWIIRIGLLVIPFIPLYIASGLFFPFITGKAFVFRGIVEIVFALWLALMVFYKEFRPKKNGLLLAISIFIGVVTLATVLGVNPLRSFWSNFERMEGLVMYIHLFMYFLVLGNVFKRRDYSILFNSAIIAGLSVGLYGVLQKLGSIPSPQGGFRVDGTIGNPAYLAAYLIFIVGFSLLFFISRNLRNDNNILRHSSIFSFFGLILIFFVLPILFSSNSNTLKDLSSGVIQWIIFSLLIPIILYFSSYIFKAQSYFWKYYYIFAGVFSLMIIYFTASRGPVLGILIASVVGGLGYLIFKKSETDSEKNIKKIIFGGLVGLVLLVGGIYALKNTEFVKSSTTLSRLTNLSFSETTVTSRFSIWQMSWKGFLEKPILGWGPENYVAVFSKYYSPEMWKQEPWFDRSHNIVFDWLINAGLLGLLSYLSIFVLAIGGLYKNFQAKKISFEELTLVVGLFIAYFFQNLFVFDNIATYISFFALLAWIYSVSTEEKTMELEKECPTMDMGYLPLFLGSILLIIIFYGYHINIRPYFVNSNLIDAISYGNYSETALGYYKGAFNEKTFLGRDEVIGQFVTFAISAIKDSALSVDKKQEIISLGVKELDNAKTQNPLDPRPFMYSSLFYESIGQIEKSIENMNAAVKISPLKQDIVLNLARLYLGQNEFEKALPIIEKTFNEDSSHPDARIDLAAAYILMGNQVKADQLLLDGFGRLDITSDILLKSYSIVKKYNRMVEIWKRLVRENPNNTNFRKGLAGAYLLNNQRSEAVETLRSILVINPALDSEINTYIIQIQSGQL